MNSVSRYKEVAIRLRNEGKLIEAIDIYGEAIRAKPTAVLYHHRAYVYNQLGRFDEAIADATRAVTLDVTLGDAFNNRAWAYLKKGNFTSAITDCDAAIRRNHANGYAFFVRAIAKKASGSAGASDDHAKAIELNPALARFDPEFQK